MAACGSGSTIEQPIVHPDAPSGAPGASPDARTNSNGAPDAPGSRVVPDAAEPAPVVPDAPTAGSTDPARHFVTASLTLAKTIPEANALAFDLDGDGKPDNQLGKSLALVASTAGIDATGYINDALVAGTFVILHSLRATGADDATAAWQVYVGDPQAAPDLTSGHGMFNVAAISPVDAIVTGSIAGGHFAGGPDEIVVSIALAPGSAPVTLHLLAAHVAADVTATGCTGGRVGGAIPLADVQDQILPSVAAALDNQIASDGDCRTNNADCSLGSQIILGLFDTNGDRHITADEVAANALTKNFLKPDVDLLDADGNPGHDGVNDSLSAALGFTCTGAVFDAPNE